MERDVVDIENLRWKNKGDHYVARVDQRRMDEIRSNFEDFGVVEVTSASTATEDVPCYYFVRNAVDNNGSPVVTNYLSIPASTAEYLKEKQGITVAGANSFRQR